MLKKMQEKRDKWMKSWRIFIENWNPRKELNGYSRNQKHNIGCLRSFIYMLIRKLWCRTLGPCSTPCPTLHFSKKKWGNRPI